MKNENNNGVINITVSISKNLKDIFDDILNSNCQSRSKVVEKLIQDFVMEHYPEGSVSKQEAINIY